METKFTDSQKQGKIFILGATGFIGFAVTKRLVAMGFKNLYCLYRSESKKDTMFKGLDTSSITFLHGSASQLDVLCQGIQDADIILNASGAASDWGIKQEIWKVNVDAPRAMVGVLEETNATTHYIQITSAVVYGFGEQMKTEVIPLVKSDPFYSSSKVDIHTWLREEIKKDHKFPISILAPTIVWGPGDQIYIPGIIEMLKTTPFYIGKGEGMAFVHIDDLVDGILLCFYNKRAYNEEYLLNGQDPFTFPMYINKIAEFSELPQPTKTIPVQIALGIGSIMELTARLVNVISPDFRPFITRLTVLLFSRPTRSNISKAKHELGYEPKITFSEGIGGIKDYVRQCLKS